MKNSICFSSAVRRITICSACAIAGFHEFSGASALAQDQSPATNAQPPTVEAAVNASYTGDGKTHFNGATRQNSDAWNVDLGINGHETLTDKWSLRWDLSSANYFLTAVSGTPTPDKINTLRLGVGASYELNDKWSLSAVAGPKFYKFDDIGTDDIGFVGMLNAVWNVNHQVTGFFGVRIEPDNRLPVIPFVGVDWRITPEWELQMIFPQPGIYYHYSRDLAFYLGASAASDTFRTSGNTGDRIGLPQYDNALGYYTDIRVGAGVEWKLTRSLSLNVDGGYSVFREIDFQRVHEHVRFDDAPYVHAGLKVKF